jgi:thioredoxin reductase (NADPH)
MNENVYELVIIGGGPTGMSVAIEAIKNNINCLVIEKGVLVNSIYNFPINMTFFSSSKNLEIANIPFITNNEKPTRYEALEYYRRLYFHYKIPISFNEEVLNVSNQEIFEIKTNKRIVKARRIVVSTGYYDHFRPLNVPRENMAKVKHYYDDAHPYIGKDILVVGAANSACDVALETWSKGANVTMVIRGDQLYQGVKYWILPNVENRIKEGAIKAYFNTQVLEIRDQDVLIQAGEEKIAIKNDYVLAMTGYKINYELLSKLGIEFENDENQFPFYDPETLESNVKNMYVAGVLLSGNATSKLFIENTRHHAELIIKDIIAKLGK